MTGGMHAQLSSSSPHPPMPQHLAGQIRPQFPLAPGQHRLLSPDMRAPVPQSGGHPVRYPGSHKEQQHTLLDELLEQVRNNTDAIHFVLSKNICYLNYCKLVLSDIMTLCVINSMGGSVIGERGTKATGRPTNDVTSTRRSARHDGPRCPATRLDSKLSDACCIHLIMCGYWYFAMKHAGLKVIRTLRINTSRLYVVIFYHVPSSYHAPSSLLFLRNFVLMTVRWDSRQLDCAVPTKQSCSLHGSQSYEISLPWKFQCFMWIICRRL